MILQKVCADDPCMPVAVLHCASCTHCNQLIAGILPGIAAAQQKWDAFCPVYAAKMQVWSLPSVTTLLAHVPRDKPVQVLELGCGPGAGTALVASWLHEGSAITATDVSEAMIAAATKACEGSRVPVRCVQTPAHHVPLPDNSVDVVFASLVLMIVPDPWAALAEVRRVLKPGGRLVFSVWGRAANSAMFCAMPAALAAAGHAMEPDARSNFDFAKDESDMLVKLRGLGFDDLLHWHLPLSIGTLGAEAAANTLAELTPGNRAMLAKVPESDRPKVMRELTSQMQQRMQGGRPCALDVLVVIAGMSRKHARQE